MSYTINSQNLQARYAPPISPLSRHAEVTIPLRSFGMPSRNQARIVCLRVA